MKLKNRNADSSDQQLASFYDTGLNLEVFGSYATGLSTRASDLDLRVNDFYTYRYLNLEKVARNLTFIPGYSLDHQEELRWNWRKYKSRLRLINYFKQAKVPVLKMLD